MERAGEPTPPHGASGPVGTAHEMGDERTIEMRHRRRRSLPGHASPYFRSDHRLLTELQIFQRDRPSPQALALLSARHARLDL